MVGHGLGWGERTPLLPQPWLQWGHRVMISLGSKEPPTCKGEEKGSVHPVHTTIFLFLISYFRKNYTYHLGYFLIFNLPPELPLLTIDPLICHFFFCAMCPLNQDLTMKIDKYATRHNLNGGIQVEWPSYQTEEREFSRKSSSLFLVWNENVH